MCHTDGDAGNLTARGSDTFQYDQANRLISATVGGVATTYTYNGDGLRVSSTSNGVTTRLVYDVHAGLPVLLDDGARTYVWGAQGLAYSVDKSSGAALVYHTDGLGSVRALSDNAGNVVQTYGTDEFGVPDAALTQGSMAQPFGYTGEQQLGTGLVDLRARMYDPQLGRFLRRDGFSGFTTEPLSLNRFSYVQNNPITLTDPSGRCGVLITVCVGAGAGALTGAGIYFVQLASTRGATFSWRDLGANVGAGVAGGAIVGGLALVPVVAGAGIRVNAAIGAFAGLGMEAGSELLSTSGQLNPGSLIGAAVGGAAGGAIAGALVGRATAGALAEAVAVALPGSEASLAGTVSGGLLYQAPSPPAGAAASPQGLAPPALPRAGTGSRVKSL